MKMKIENKENINLEINITPSKEEICDIINIIDGILEDENNTIYINVNSIEIYYESMNEYYNLNIDYTNILSISVNDASESNSVKYYIDGIFNKYKEIIVDAARKRNEKKFQKIYSFFDNKFKLNRIKNLNEIIE